MAHNSRVQYSSTSTVSSTQHSPNTYSIGNWLKLLGWGGIIVGGILLIAELGVRGTITRASVLIGTLGLFTALCGLAITLGAWHREQRAPTAGLCDKELSGDELVDHSAQYPRVGEYVISRIDRIHSPYGSEKIVTAIPTPLGVEEWEWTYPVAWTVENTETPFVEFAEARGFSRETFDQLEGHPVLITRKNRQWELHMDPPEHCIAAWISSGTISWNEIQLGAIQEQFDLDLEVDGHPVTESSGIIVENLPDEFEYGE